MYFKFLSIIVLWLCVVTDAPAESVVGKNALLKPDVFKIETLYICFDQQSRKLTPIQSVFDTALAFVSSKNIVFPSTLVDTYAIIKKNRAGDIVVEINFWEKRYRTLVSVRIDKEQKVESWSIKKDVPLESVPLP